MNKLTVYYSTTFTKVKEYYYCNGAFGRFIDELAKNYSEVNLCVPVKEEFELDSIDYRIKSSNIKIQEMPNYKNIIGSIKYTVPSIKKLINFSRKWEDSVYIRWPSPYSYIVFLLAKSKNLKTIAHIVGDTKSVIENGDKYKGIIKKMAIVYANVEDFLLKIIMKKSINISNGSGMRRVYKSNSIKVSEIRTSTIMKSDINIKKDDLSLSKSIKLLYVGYLRQEKGIKYLLQAIRTLKENMNKDISLTIVGDGEERKNLEALVESLNIKENVTFKGHIPLGDKLFEVYKENDIFILPSLSEGTPRVLIEAMANGLIIVSTDVGGIPFTISNNENGILIKPHNSDEIYQSIVNITKDEENRNKLRLNGYKFAELNTLERHIKEVVGIMEGVS